MFKRWIPTILMGIVLSAWTLSPVHPTVMSEKPAGPLSFELFKDAQKEFRWKLKAANGRIMAISSDGYSSKSSCQSAIDTIKQGASRAPVEDNSKD